MSYQCVMTVGAALGAFLPTLVTDVGYTGAIAQVSASACFSPTGY